MSRSETKMKSGSPIEGGTRAQRQLWEDDVQVYREISTTAWSPPCAWELLAVPRRSQAFEFSISSICWIFFFQRILLSLFPSLSHLSFLPPLPPPPSPAFPCSLLPSTRYIFLCFVFRLLPLGCNLCKSRHCPFCSLTYANAQRSVWHMAGNQYILTEWRNIGNTWYPTSLDFSWTKFGLWKKMSRWVALC